MILPLYFQDANIKLFLGDCLELLPRGKSKSIDMILCDLPYGITARNEWDKEINIVSLWKEYERLIKDHGAMVFTAVEPFASKLIMSNLKLFRYDLIWQKTKPTGFLNANRMPLRSHENILVFYKNLPKYNPQFEIGKAYSASTISSSGSKNYNIKNSIPKFKEYEGKRYPKSVLEFSRDKQKLHPTQKPIKLFEWLIKTYTNENDTVLDNCIGSGTTAVAAKHLNRRCIGIDVRQDFLDIAVQRIKDLK